MNKWKQIWKEEIDRTVNRLDGTTECSKARKPALKRRIYSLIACACALVIAVSVCFNMLKPAPASSSVVLLEINPSIAFVIDENGKVSGYSATNSDADIILSQTGVEGMLKGLSINKALENFIDKAYQMGFVDYASDVIRISSNIDVEGIRTKLEQKFIENNINVLVAGDKLSNKDFAERLGLGVDGNQVGDIVEKVKNLPEKFMENTDKILSNINSIIAEVEDMLEHVDEVMNHYFVAEVRNLQDYFEQLAGMDTFEIFAFVSSNFDQFVVKAGEMINKLQEYRVEKNKDKYQSTRPEFDENDYRQNLNDIINVNGSLSNYFEQHKGGRRN